MGLEGYSTVLCLLPQASEKDTTIVKVVCKDTKSQNKTLVLFMLSLRISGRVHFDWKGGVEKRKSLRGVGFRLRNHPFPTSQKEGISDLFGTGKRPEVRLNTKIDYSTPDSLNFSGKDKIKNKNQRLSTSLS